MSRLRACSALDNASLINTTKDFLVVVAFLVGFLLSTIGETEWLNRRTKAGIYRSLLVASVSNILSTTLGYFFSYMVFLFAFFFAKPLMESPVLAAFFWFAFLLTVAAAPLAIMKRLLLKIARIDTLTRPWTYAIVAAIGFQISVLILPLLVALFA
jgi:hypothetical protein